MLFEILTDVSVLISLLGCDKTSSDGTRLLLCSGKRKKERPYLIYFSVTVRCPEIFVHRPTTVHLDQIRHTRKWKCSLEKSFDTRQHYT
jgi:hypothetical protein